MAGYKVGAKQNSVSGGVGLNTGVKLAPGNLLTVCVDVNDTWAAGKDQRTSNANGLGNPLGADFGTYTKGDFNFLFGSLIGSLDGGKTFFAVGTRLEMTILNKGELSLYYWDNNNADNKGTVTANVAVYEGPKV